MDDIDVFRGLWRDPNDGPNFSSIIIDQTSARGGAPAKGQVFSFSDLSMPTTIGVQH